MSKTTKTLITVCAVLLLVLVAVVGVFLVMSNNDQEVPDTAPTTEAATEASTETSPEEYWEVTEATEAATGEATEPSETAPGTEVEEVVYRNPLTGERVDAPFTNRIFAVTISNVNEALPHIGVNEADMYFEMFIVDGAVRGLALFTEIENAPQIGSVRSTRLNFTDIGLGYDAFVAHAGGSELVLSDAKTSGVEHKNIDTSSSTKYSFRDKERNSAGWGMVHCLFVDGPGLKEWATEQGIRVTKPEGTTYGLNFVDDGALEAGDTANTVSIDMIFESSRKNTTMVYDPEIGEYVYNQYGKVMKDGKTNEVESFENVFVLKVREYRKDIYLVADIESSGEGYYACDGKIIPIKWVRNSNNEPFTFTHMDGTPLFQNAGTSYINLAPLDSVISWE